jgi:hypothetical protein
MASLSPTGTEFTDTSHEAADQLEEGSCEWDASEASTALIATRGFHTELKAKSSSHEDHDL